MSGVCVASDIWSVGCTVIELLTCVPPYYDLQPMPALFRIVQIYVSLMGVEQEVETVFKPVSIDIKFHDVQGKNHRCAACAILKLNKEIVPEQCKVVVKPNRVIVTV